MTLKKILIILIILLILVVGALAVYNFFIKVEEPSQPTTGQTTTAPTATSTGPIKAISQEAVLSPVIDSQKVKYYLKSNGNVFESSFDGSQSTRISSNILPNLLKVLWSPNKDKVIAIFEEDGLLKKYLYNYNTGVSVSLDRNIRWVAWSPTENKIAYQYYDPRTENNNISTANPDGCRSPLGDKLLFSETDNRGKNLKLKIADLTKSTINELNFVTLPEKCVWSQDDRTLFCAVPKNISALATLPDDYYKGLVSFADNFWIINLDTQEKIQIYLPTDEEAASYDARELLLSPLEDYLLFINKKDGLLYTLHL